MEENMLQFPCVIRSVYDILAYITNNINKKLPEDEQIINTNDKSYLTNTGFDKLLGEIFNKDDPFFINCKSGSVICNNKFKMEIFGTQGQEIPTQIGLIYDHIDVSKLDIVSLFPFDTETPMVNIGGTCGMIDILRKMSFKNLSEICAWYEKNPYGKENEYLNNLQQNIPDDNDDFAADILKLKRLPTYTNKYNVNEINMNMLQNIKPIKNIYYTSNIYKVIIPNYEVHNSPEILFTYPTGLQKVRSIIAPRVFNLILFMVKKLYKSTPFTLYEYDNSPEAEFTLNKVADSASSYVKDNIDLSSFKLNPSKPIPSDQVPPSTSLINSSPKRTRHRPPILSLAGGDMYMKKYYKYKTKYLQLKSTL